MMDETYIEMCRKAEEIQELWEPKPGDQVIRTHTVFGEEIDRQIWDSMDHISILVQHSSVDSFIHATDSNGTSHVLKGSELEKRVYQWLPRQEDLQEIAKEQLDEPIQMAIFERFMQWLFNFSRRRVDYLTGEEYCEHGYSYKDGSMSLGSITEAWLCFVMETCYGKRWDSEKHEWVK